LTTGEIAAHFAEVYGAVMSKEQISKITDAVLEDMNGWLARPLDRVYPVVFIDAIHVKVRDGQVANRAFYVAIGVSVEGKRDILGVWASAGGEGAKFWLGVLTEIRNRGVADVCIVVCDGLKGLPDAINTTWPLAIVQTCVLHLIRNTFRLAGRQHWDAMARELRPVYTAVNEAEAKERFNEFCDNWAGRYPGVRSLWDNEHPPVGRTSRLGGCPCPASASPGAGGPRSSRPSSVVTRSRWCSTKTARSPRWPVRLA
jgi:putative transposase